MYRRMKWAFFNSYKILIGLYLFQAFESFFAGFGLLDPRAQPYRVLWSFLIYLPFFLWFFFRKYPEQVQAAAKDKDVS